MGINIYLKQWHPPYLDHCDWDTIRYGGDRDFPDFCRDMPKMDHPKLKEIYDHYDESPFRPYDFKLWRLAIRKSKLLYRARYLKLMSLCEQNPDYWISWMC